MNPYSILGLKKGASPAEIKKAYRKLAHETQPDKNPNDKKAEERFKEINEAYTMLTNPEKAQSSNQRNRVNINDIFSQFGGFGGFGVGNQQTQQVRQQVVQVNLTFKESCFGVVKNITFTYQKKCQSCNAKGAKKGDFDTCKSCNGTGARMANIGNSINFSVGICRPCGGKGIKINKSCSDCKGIGSTSTTDTKPLQIPSLVETNFALQVRIDNENLLIVQILVDEDKDMRREGVDIYTIEKIKLKDALLGTKVNIPTLHGKKLVTIKECTSPGTKVRLKNCGAKKYQDKEEYGNHIVVIEIEFPQSLQKEQKDKIKEVFE